ncbi:MAG: hypothetical protein IPI98_04470 [Chitinophagaceae bacterium]|nr:hypothetical protein [Chitinophagaceae bacterium]
MDAIWVKILQELREFGFSIDKIRAAKESLSFLSDKCGVPMPFLEFYTAFALGGKMPVVILFFPDGVAVPQILQFKVTKVLSRSQFKSTKNIAGIFSKS